MNDNPHPNNDRDLAALAAEIDRLAFEDRGDAGLEARIYAATLPVLQTAKQPPLRLVASDMPSGVAARRTGARSAMRIAAGFAIAATAALAWLGGHRTPTATAPGTMMAGTSTQANGNDEWAMASSLFDDGLSTEINNLSTATSDLRTTIDLSDTLEEGAM